MPSLSPPGLRTAAYQIDPVLWVREVLGVIPTAWQETFLRAQRGASILALTARQVGKTTTAAWAIAHAMLFMPGSLSVIACPAQRQSAEAVRRVRDILGSSASAAVPRAASLAMAFDETSFKRRLFRAARPGDNPSVDRQAKDRVVAARQRQQGTR